jgi:hypothetical protein
MEDNDFIRVSNSLSPNVGESAQRAREGASLWFRQRGGFLGGTFASAPRKHWGVLFNDGLPRRFASRNDAEEFR